MPVKVIHWRYVFLDVDEKHDPDKLKEIFKQLFGLQLLYISGLKTVQHKGNTAIYAISSKYVPQLLASTIFYGEKYGEKILLKGISATLKSGKRYLL